MNLLSNTIEKRVKAAMERDKKLIKVILGKVFRGELFSNEAELVRFEGRSYESASELLARIKADRETSKKV